MSCQLKNVVKLGDLPAGSFHFDPADGSFWLVKSDQNNCHVWQINRQTAEAFLRRLGIDSLSACNVEELKNATAPLFTAERMLHERKTGGVNPSASDLKTLYGALGESMAAYMDACSDEGGTVGPLPVQALWKRITNIEEKIGDLLQRNRTDEKDPAVPDTSRPEVAVTLR